MHIIRYNLPKDSDKYLRERAQPKAITKTAFQPIKNCEMKTISESVNLNSTKKLFNLLFPIHFPSPFYTQKGQFFFYVFLAHPLFTTTTTTTTTVEMVDSVTIFSAKQLKTCRC